jgi:steroid Delta-isomerase
MIGDQELQRQTFMADCERIHREWHECAKGLDTEGLLRLYAEDAVLESPLVPAILDDKPDGVLRGHVQLRRRLLIWEYPRQAPDGDQVDLVEVMEIAVGLIRHHRVYWGWKGCKLIAPALSRRATA